MILFVDDNNGILFLKSIIIDSVKKIIRLISRVTKEIFLKSEL